MPPAARQTDKVVGVDVHIVMIPTPGGEVPTPLPHPYDGTIVSNCSTDVMIGGMGAATLGSMSSAVHIPQGGRFQIPPTGQGTVMKGSATVLINNKPAARMGDTVQTCNDPAPAPTSTITGGAPTVMIGG
jgi:uncharacterized Zn-binding protein involved in type VI secretion